jgi:hypothetical protein
MKEEHDSKQYGKKRGHGNFERCWIVGDFLLSATFCCAKTKQKKKMKKSPNIWKIKPRLEYISQSVFVSWLRRDQFDPFFRRF